MDQMTKIREQQESLAKLHFELAAAEEDSLEHGNEFNTNKAQENMLQLMQRLEQLSISIEQLQTSHTGLWDLAQPQAWDQRLLWLWAHLWGNEECQSGAGLGFHTRLATFRRCGQLGYCVNILSCTLKWADSMGFSC